MSIEKRELTCIVCPLGCQLRVTLDGNAVVSVEGNTCPRGEKYALDECTHPMRTVTTTARTSDGGLIAVKTNRTVPKEKMMECMREINRITVALPAHVGDVVLENLLGTGADVVVTANRE